MQCPTHKLIAHKVYEIMYSYFGISFDYESLLEGSIAPDTKLYMLLIPHTLKQSIWLLRKITRKSFSVKNESSEKSSYKMGIAIHFVSDYFCTAHNDIKYLNPITHYIYEKRLKHFIKKNINKMQIDLKKCQTEMPEDINEFINRKHKEYLLSERSMRNDLIFSLEAAVIFAIYVTSTILKEEGYRTDSSVKCQGFLTV